MFARSYLAPIALVGAVLGGTVAAIAQSSPTTTVAPAPVASPYAMPGRHHGGWRAALATLNLTPDQSAKINSLMQTDRASMTAAQTAGTPPDPQARRAMHAKMMADIESVLTPDQKTQFEASMHHHRTPGMAPAPQASPA